MTYHQAYKLRPGVAEKMKETKRRYSERVFSDPMLLGRLNEKRRARYQLNKAKRKADEPSLSPPQNR